MSHGFVVNVERQILLVVGGIQWPIGRCPATVAKSVGVPRIKYNYVYKVPIYYLEIIIYSMGPLYVLLL